MNLKALFESEQADNATCRVIANHELSESSTQSLHLGGNFSTKIVKIGQAVEKIWKEEISRCRVTLSWRHLVSGRHLVPRSGIPKTFSS